MQKIDPKLAAVAGILLLWFALVLSGQATAGPGADLVSALKDILVWLLGYHAVTTLQPVAGSDSAKAFSAAAASAAPAVISALETASPEARRAVAVAQEAAPVVEAVAAAVEQAQ